MTDREKKIIEVIHRAKDCPGCDDPTCKAIRDIRSLFTKGERVRVMKKVVEKYPLRA